VVFGIGTLSVVAKMSEMCWGKIKTEFSNEKFNFARKNQCNVNFSALKITGKLKL
jgi:hypothetical protein